MGGSAHEWVGILTEDLVPGGSLLVDLTMSKLDPPDVVIAYEIRLESGLFADGFESGTTRAWSAALPESGVKTAPAQPVTSGHAAQPQLIHECRSRPRRGSG